MVDGRPVPRPPRPVPPAHCADSDDDSLSTTKSVTFRLVFFSISRFPVNGASRSSSPASNPVLPAHLPKIHAATRRFHWCRAVHTPVQTAWGVPECQVNGSSSSARHATHPDSPQKLDLRVLFDKLALKALLKEWTGEKHSSAFRRRFRFFLGMASVRPASGCDRDARGRGSAASTH